MTICIGWKDANAVYLAANSAVTSSRSLTAARIHLANFTMLTAADTVEESALKFLGRLYSSNLLRCRQR